MSFWLGLKAFGSLAGGLIGSYWKIGLTVALVAAIGTAAWKINGWKTDRDALLEERKGTIAELTQNLTIAEMERNSAQAALFKAEQEKRRILENQNALLLTQDLIRAEIREQKKIFEDHDFARLVAAKPGLIEKLSNKATAERFDDLEATFND